VVPVYPATEGRRQSENGKTCVYQLYLWKNTSNVSNITILSN